MRWNNFTETAFLVARSYEKLKIDTHTSTKGSNRITSLKFWLKLLAGRLLNGPRLCMLCFLHVLLLGGNCISFKLLPIRPLVLEGIETIILCTIICSVVNKGILMHPYLAFQKAPDNRSPPCLIKTRTPPIKSNFTPPRSTKRHRRKTSDSDLQ